MIRRKTLLFFNFFALVITMALMVLPHHHHEGDVCIINAACHADPQHNGEDDEQGQSNQHSHCDKNHVYLLEKGLVVRSNNLVLLLKTPQFASNLKILDLHFSASSISNIINYIPSAYTRDLFGPESCLSSRYLNLSQGLRAPPLA